tara:strand:+ start:1502 stop:2449 length:948 start_codon:yes stop_codon:yes gene_type:complete
MSWGNATKTAPAATPNPAMKTAYDVDYYKALFNNNQAKYRPVRMALVGRENTAKTGLALDLCRAEIEAGKKVVILDVDNSAKQTVDYLFPGKENVVVLPLFDEMDESIFNEDNSANHTALIDKVSWFTNIIADQIKDGEEYAAVIFDGGSTFLKWCEQAMTQSLLRRGVIKEEGDSFNQKEWRERNRLFQNTIQRIHGLDVPKVFFTFHLKAIQEYVDNGSGGKVLMTVGERPEWDKGTMRCFSQQIFLTRYMKRPDPAAGVKGDKTLADGEWAVRANIEEMKGQHMEHLGETHTILSVKDKKVKWNGLPFLVWE